MHRARRDDIGHAHLALAQDEITAFRRLQQLELHT